MLAVLAPGYLWLAAAGVAVLLGAHYIVLREPPGSILPTARFVPAGRLSVRRWARRPVDGLLLALRSAAVILVGAAFAHVRVQTPRAPLISIVLLDESSDAGDPVAAARAAQSLLTASSNRNSLAVLILFDTAATERPPGTLDSLLRQHPTANRAPGSLSTALIAGLRTAASLRYAADSLELTVISPALQSEADAATDSIRALWPGEIRLVRLAAQRGTSADPQSRWISASDRDWAPRAPADTVNAVTSGDIVVVDRFVRRWRYIGQGARVIARWVDGEPAAVERQQGRGCEREIAIPLPPPTDVANHTDLRDLLDVLRAPCGGSRSAAIWTPAPASVKGRSRVAAASFPAPDLAGTTSTRWLLAAALALLLIETALRRRTVAESHLAPAAT